RESVSVEGVSGTLELPHLPDWTGSPNDPLHMPLQPPRTAVKWKRGETPIQWGRPIQFPAGISSVDRVLFEFSAPGPELRRAATAVHRGLGRWRERYIAYMELVTKQRSHRTLEVRNSTDGIDVFSWVEDRTSARPYDSNITEVIITQSSDTE